MSTKKNNALIHFETLALSLSTLWLQVIQHQDVTVSTPYYDLNANSKRIAEDAIGLTSASPTYVGLKFSLVYHYLK
jgi:hypothetical protein